MMWDKEIDIRDVKGLCIGNVQDTDAMTGVTALVFPEGATVGCKISGGGPASRETGLTYSETAENLVHSIVLSGGSAFGLAASQGVMECLEEHNIGYRTPFALVPLVVSSCLYDLNFGSSTIRPDAEMGREACSAALSKETVMQGNVGAGTGATVGKLRTMKNASKSGLGWYAVQLGDLQCAAIVAVNAMGDVYDGRTGEKLAGMKTDDRTGWIDAEDYLAQLYRDQKAGKGGVVQNTTIGAVICNIDATKAQMNKIASMAQNAYARCIRPVATMSDGDTIYAAGTGGVKADVNLVGSLCAQVMGRAIRNAITEAAMHENEFLSKISQ